jgi:hypothetical protein
MTNAHDLNEWIRVLPQFHDPMNDYRPAVLWLDTDSGTFGDARSLVLLDTTAWSSEDSDVFDEWSDSERNLYGILVSEKYGRNPGKIPTPSEINPKCQNCDTGNGAEYEVITNSGTLLLCEACHND